MDVRYFVRYSIHREWPTFVAPSELNYCAVCSIFALNYFHVNCDNVSPKWWMRRLVSGPQEGEQAQTSKILGGSILQFKCQNHILKHIKVACVITMGSPTHL